MLKKILSINLDWFARKSSQRFIPEIDALRFFAIIPVMLVHFSGALLSHNSSFDRALIDQENNLRHILIQGNFGVHLFFAISGFILTLPFLRNINGNISLKKYFLRRLIRIEPPYLIAITIFLVTHIALQEQSIAFLLERYFASFFYVHSAWFSSSSYILPVAWSLEIEVQFYLLMPLLIYFIKFLKTAYWRAFIYILLLLTSIFIDILPFSDLNDFMLFFLAGIISADIYLNINIKKSVLWDFVFAICMFSFFAFNIDPLRFFLLVGIIVASFNVVWLRKFLNNRLVTVIGGMCYSLYLLHYPLYHLMMKLFSNMFTVSNSFEWTYLVQSIIFVPISIVIMGGYFLLVEKPFMVLSQKMGKQVAQKSEIKKSSLPIN
ncbi:MAG: acyltransferase family protein [Allomuricauda sp.]